MGFSRGNHEDCHRSWKGWFYFFDPEDLPNNPGWDESDCQAYSKPYTVPLGDHQLVVMDTSSIPSVYKTPNPEQVNHFKQELDLVFASISNQPTWFSAHHPIWGVSSWNANSPNISALEPTLQAAVAKSQQGALPKHINLLLAGHVHLFEALQFDDGRPPQFIFGGGGTKLSPAITQQLFKEHPEVLTTLSLKQSEFSTFHDFDFGIIEPTNNDWNITIKSLDSNDDVPGPYFIER